MFDGNGTPKVKIPLNWRDREVIKHRLLLRQSEMLLLQSTNGWIDEMVSVRKGYENVRKND